MLITLYLHRVYSRSNTTCFSPLFYHVKLSKYHLHLYRKFPSVFQRKTVYLPRNGKRAYVLCNCYTYSDSADTCCYYNIEPPAHRYIYIYIRICKVNLLGKYYQWTLAKLNNCGKRIFPGEFLRITAFTNVQHKVVNAHNRNT